LRRRNEARRTAAAGYDELRRLAATKMRGEADGHTLDVTELVIEAWLKLNAHSFASKTEFVKAAAVAMRRILVDHARAKKDDKRGLRLLLEEGLDDGRVG
jgi:hypothetical protein